LETARKPNDLAAETTKLCLVLEQHRRTAVGRVRTSEEFLVAFFPHDATRSEDRVFRHMPREVRGPVLAAWGIRGPKAAARDDDDRVQSVVHDALVAGDIDHGAFEEGLSPELIVRWVALPSLWGFWRGGKPTKPSIEKALVTGYELGLFDAKWLLDTLETGGGKLRGTDVLAAGLSKADLTAWVGRVHASGDGTPRGLLEALGWENVVSKTSNEVLVAVLDALAAKVGLVKSSETEAAAKEEAAPAPAAAAAEDTPEPMRPPEATIDDEVEVDDSSATEMFVVSERGKRPESVVPPSAKERQRPR